ncbi:MAG: hypothetical protein IPL87_02395 [Candidatus Moraniibacteriota bacterium]|nr:MAG: hypothetical protein IPL87_02395 [Candidatus Moranbacteria bacterium]
MAGLTGSLSMKNPERESDWDFFVVLEAGHIWTGRAFATLVLHLLGMRRHGKKIRNRACLNFWVTTDSLEIRLKDIFSSNEYMFLIPLFDDGVFDQFQSANRWMKRFRPNFAPAFLPHRSRVRDTTLTQKIRGLGETVLSSRRLEAFLRKIQHNKIARNPKTALSEGIIEANDARLVFLPKPRGPKVFEAFRRRLSEVETIALS